jgi:hypothetical protein
MTEHSGRQGYSTPEIEDYGTVADLTETGNTNPGSDVKGGSRPTPGR